MSAPQIAASPRNNRKVKTGVVTSNKMMKTIIVKVSRLVPHQKYSRVMHQTSSFKAHDETNSAAIGDWVKIMETRPISRDKRWRLVEILTRASSAPPVPGQEEPPKKTARKPLPAAQRQGQAGTTPAAVTEQTPA